MTATAAEREARRVAGRRGAVVEIAAHGTASPKHPAARWSERELRMFSGLSFDGLKIIRAAGDEDFAMAAKLRQDGFGRLLPKQQRADYPWLDALDHRPEVVVLLAMTEDGTPLGTLRVQDGRQSRLEIEAHVAIARHVPAADRPLAQYARLSIIKHARRHDVMYGLFKAAWCWTVRNHINGIIIATPPWAKPIYAGMMFRELHPSARFSHGFGAPVEHTAMLISTVSSKQMWKTVNHPLFHLWFDTEHLNVEEQCNTQK